MRERKDKRERNRWKTQLSEIERIEITAKKRKIIKEVENRDTQKKRD